MMRQASQYLVVLHAIFRKYYLLRSLSAVFLSPKSVRLSSMIRNCAQFLCYSCPEVSEFLLHFFICWSQNLRDRLIFPYEISRHFPKFDPLGSHLAVHIHRTSQMRLATTRSFSFRISYGVATKNRDTFHGAVKV